MAPARARWTLAIVTIWESVGLWVGPALGSMRRVQATASGAAMRPSDLDVVVVGAGFAGLYQLYKEMAQALRGFFKATLPA